MSQVAAVRAFNRFYTREIGVLDEGLLASPYSLVEVRLLYELAQRKQATATGLGQALAIDAGYMSRLLAKLAGRHLVARRSSRADRRESFLSLTARGRAVFARLDARSDADVKKRLAPLDGGARQALVASMRNIATLLGDASGATSRTFTVRAPRAGDLGSIVHRHGALYAAEYGWDERFEGLVAGIVAKYAAAHDPRREHCFIAESDGAVAGCVMLVAKSRTVAQLRLLLVEPGARGLGIGGRLVDECIAFARRAGYRRIELWTNDVLVAARRIYERAGFRLVAAAPHKSFGKGLVGQTFRLDL